MKRLPRLLPLIAVALVGVLAINLFSGARSLPELIQGARAFAEDVAQPDAEPEAAAETERSASPLPARPMPEPVENGAVCAPTAAELAEQAGLSPNELMALQRLGQRRSELNELDADIDTQLQLLLAAEVKIDERLALMQELTAEMRELLDIADEQEETETTRLVKVYENMRPQSAAAALAVMDDAVRLPIASRMKERNLAAVFRYMSAEDAREITEKLAAQTAERFSFSQARAMADEAAEAETQAAESASPTPQRAAQAPPAADTPTGPAADEGEAASG